MFGPRDGYGVFMNCIELCILGILLGHPALSLTEPCEEDDAYDDATFYWPSWESS